MGVTDEKKDKLVLYLGAIAGVLFIIWLFYMINSLMAS